MDRNSLCFCGSGKKHKKCHNDIEDKSAFAEIINLYKKTDILIESNSKMGKLKCKKGCAECCYQNFYISASEFYYLSYQIYKKHGIERLDDYLHRGYDMWVKYETEYPENAKMLTRNVEGEEYKAVLNALSIMKKEMDNSPMYNEFPCPFLNIEGKYCEVYEDRPFVCRHYGVGYLERHNEIVAYCSHTADGDDYEEYMADISSLFNEAKNINTYPSSRGVPAMERYYPIFYFCKIHYKQTEKFLERMGEYKDITKERLRDVKAYRMRMRSR